MTLSWDAADERVVVEVFPFTEEAVVEPGTPEEEIEEPEPEEVLVVRLPAGLARAFSKRAQAVVSAGRPPCPFCGGPLDPAGHLCPRANGFRRTAPNPRRDPSRRGDAMDEHDLLNRGELEIRGRIMPASNATFFGAVVLGEPECRVRLQAGRGGAAAVGLPRRHPGRARGRGLRRLRGARLGRRAADGAARGRTRGRGDGAGLARARPRSGPGRPGARGRGAGGLPARPRRVRRRRPAHLAGARGQRRAAPDGGVRRRRQQRRPQGRARAGDDRRPPLRRRPRGLFNVDDKLRTVLWGWAHEPLEPDDAASLRSLADQLCSATSELRREPVRPARRATRSPPRSPAASGCCAAT